jgi:N-carbamoyl-L-amino-acid hydrolase
MNVDAERLGREIDQLAAISAAKPPAVTRVVFTEEDLQARAWLKQRCADAGLAIRVDAVGNTFFRWEGSRPDLPAVATGSHIDAIPNAGRFDEWSECWVGWRRFARCARAAFGRSGRLN